MYMTYNVSYISYYMKVELLGQGSKCQGTLGLGFLLHHLHSPLDLEMYSLIPSFHKPPLLGTPV